MKDRDLSASQYLSATVANLAIATCQMQGAKELKAKDFDAVLMIQEFDRARDLLSVQDARVIQSLIKDSKIPSWALRELDIELINLAAK